MDKDTDQKILLSCLMILTGIALTGVLIYTRPILVPFTVAVFTFIATLPIVNFMSIRWKIPYGLAIVFTVVLTFLGFSLLIGLVSSSFRELGSSFSVYRDNLAGLITTIAQALAPYGIEFGTNDLQQALRELPVMLFARNLTEILVTFIANFFLIAVFVIFLFLGDARSAEQNPVFKEISDRISKYLFIKLLTSATTGILVGSTLAIIGVDLAFFFGVMAFTLNFVPNVGSILATILPLPIAFLQFGLGMETLLAVAIPGIIQFSVGNIVEPKFMGDRMDLHPITVLFFLVFWGLVWGIPGMFLSVPIMSTLKIIFNQFHHTKTLSELLAGRGIFPPRAPSGEESTSP